jgi:hypothetical protein
LGRDGGHPAVLLTQSQERNMHQSSIVLELQALATDRRNDITDLLRKSLLVATKLKLDDFRSWANYELHGYRDGSEVPNYRKVRCEVKAKNPYYGLIPIVFADKKINDILCDADIRDPIEALDNLLSSKQEKGAYLQVPLSTAQVNFIMEHQDDYLQLPPVRIVGRNQVSAVVDAVRTRILEWSLQLETEGVLGVGMTFTKEEKARAMASSSINIQNFQGVLGSVANSTLTQNLTLNIHKGDFGSLSRALNASGVSEEDIQELKVALEADPVPEVAGSFGTRGQ